MRSIPEIQVAIQEGMTTFNKTKELMVSIQGNMDKLDKELYLAQIQELVSVIERLKEMSPREGRVIVGKVKLLLQQASLVQAKVLPPQPATRAVPVAVVPKADEREKVAQHSPPVVDPEIGRTKLAKEEAELTARREAEDAAKRFAAAELLKSSLADMPDLSGELPQPPVIADRKGNPAEGNLQANEGRLEPKLGTSMTPLKTPSDGVGTALRNVVVAAMSIVAPERHEA